MRSLPDGEYKYICHVRDHYSRFSWARAIRQKEAIEVAAYLFDLFTMFGPPSILQCDNGKEFTASVIINLISLWPNTKIINGSPRHPETQGSVERANGILQNKLAKWMEDTKRADWTWGLKLVINAMNISICRATNQLPYILVFGTKPRGNCSLISELWAQGIRNEEDIPKEIGIEEVENNSFAHITEVETENGKKTKLLNIDPVLYLDFQPELEKVKIKL
jgi:hypothetical protein